MNWSEDLNQIISIFLSIRSLKEFKAKFEELINQNSLVSPIKTRLQIDQVMNQNNKRHPEREREYLCNWLVRKDEMAI